MDAETELAVLGARMPYASRAGSKLEAALVSFSVDVAGRRCLDVGASDGRVHGLPSAAGRGPRRRR